MALQTAEDARTAWESRHTEYKDYNSLTVIAINAALTSAAEPTIIFPLLIEKKSTGTVIIQSDATQINLDYLVVEIRAKGYQVSIVLKHTTANLHICF